MSSRTYWLDKLSGDKSVALEQRVFNGALLVSIASFLIAIVLSVWQGWSWVSLIMLAYIGLFAGIYRLARVKAQLQRSLLLFFISVMLLLSGFWLLDPNAQSGLASYFFVLLVVAAFTAEKPQAYIIAVLVNVLLLGLFAETLRAQINWQAPYSAIGQFLTFYTALVYLAALALLYKRLTSDKDSYELLQTLQQLHDESLKTNQVADGLTQASDTLSASVLQQKTAIEQLLVSTEELAVSAEQNRSISLDSIRSLATLEQRIEQSKQTADTFVGIGEQINQSSQEVQSINNLINDIAWQTNLLSLNAMIEAARAGEEHAGFRVVALEVKRLAESTAEAAGNINQLLAQNATLIESGMLASREVQQAFELLSQQVQPVSFDVRSMSEASVEQTHAILQINQGLADIDRAVEFNQRAADDVASSASALRENADNLIHVVAKV